MPTSAATSSGDRSFTTYSTNAAQVVGWKSDFSSLKVRSTTAVQLLHSGVERSLIALWLGHESLQSTQIYVDTALDFKERILNRTPRLDGHVRRLRADDRLFAFLKSL